MSAGFYAVSVLFFTALIAAFMVVACSVLLQIRENYYRYFQKADLQWTGSEGKFPKGRINPFLVLLVSLAVAWSLVHFVIRPG